MRTLVLSWTVVALICTVFLIPSSPSFVDDPLVATFSIVGIDLENGDVGVAVQSKFFPHNSSKAAPCFVVQLLFQFRNDSTNSAA